MTLDPFYLIVDSADWIDRLVPIGVKLVQLRMKNIPEHRLRDEIRRAKTICVDHGCQFIVNDYWQEAIAAGAEYIHLGQEDLAAADLTAIKAAGLKLGISTHTPKELDIALAAKPDYVALGPIWETRLKTMPYGTQGLGRVTEWKRRIGAMPLVAIGGITPERAPSVLAAGADSVAVITDFMTHADPDSRMREWLAWASGVRQ